MRLRDWIAAICALSVMLFLASCSENGKSRTDDREVQSDGSYDGQFSDSVLDDDGTASVGSDDGSTVERSETQTDGKDEIRFIFRDKNDGGTLAVWWWNVNHFFDEALREQYLDFLQMNRINEIYLCYPNMDMDRMVEIVRECGKRGMEVSLLSGDCWWIDPDNHGEDAVIREFLDYQNYAPQDAKLSSLHMDVEPHQRSDFSTDRDAVLQKYADMVCETASIIYANGEKIEWDIPFWFDNYTVQNENGQTVLLLEHLGNHADTLCLMSYRDKAEDILSISEEEITICLESNCKVILGIETHSSEGDYVSFMEEGKYTMYFEMRDVYHALAERMPKDKFGMAVHYLDTWFPLKEK